MKNILTVFFVLALIPLIGSIIVIVLAILFLYLLYALSKDIVIAFRELFHYYKFVKRLKSTRK